MSLGVDAFKGQKYSKIKSDLLKKGELFVDPEFPANNKSLFYSKVDNEIEWKRPSELCKVPKLVVEGVTNDDLNEGDLGNTWFVSACSSLAQEPKMWTKVIPDAQKQEFTLEGQYAGIFHFQFWRYGRWIDVVVDDMLPTKDNKLVFCHSNSRNEFWSALLEKAYAKLYGDYETLAAGFTADALVDFTGGVPEKIDIQAEGMGSNPEKKERFFVDLKDAVELKALVTVCIACGKGEAGEQANQGLIKGHGYGITDVKEIQVAKALKGALGAEKLYLLRLRNPWGTKEWTGAWSDESSEWNAVTSRDRDKMGIKFIQEGEFWMAYDDFLANFTNCDICHFVNTSIFSLKKTWNEFMVQGEWTLGAKGTSKDRAGGNDESPSFLDNPQYCFDITAVFDTILVALEQEDSSVHKAVGAEHMQIGFHIMKVEENRKYRVHEGGKEVAKSEYKTSRNVFLKAVLPKGRYVMIPSTVKAGLTGRFLLRMYTSASAHAKAQNLANKANQEMGYLRALIKDCPKPGMPCIKPHVLVTRVRVQKAEKIQQNEKVKSMDAYVIIKCEGETVKSLPAPSGNDPEFEFNCIFYRKKPDLQPITIEVVNKNMVVDDFVGLATINEQGEATPKVIELDLFGKKKKELEIQKPGKLIIELTSDGDLTAF